MQKIASFDQFCVFLTASQSQSDDFLKSIKESVRVAKFKMEALYIQLVEIVEVIENRLDSV